MNSRRPALFRNDPIAEAELNHNGSLDRGLNRVEMGAQRVAYAVKFETVRADRLARSRLR